VLELAQSRGGRIASSQICFHRSEDGCDCRKPRTGLLETAFRENPGFERYQTWMVGDGVTDVQAGAAFGAHTAFLGPRKCDACKVFENSGLNPAFWGENLSAFARFLAQGDR
jgi:D-glycero-D-manno-heptose 1,7-bisphosphate phosphatase